MHVRKRPASRGEVLAHPLKLTLYSSHDSSLAEQLVLRAHPHLQPDAMSTEGSKASVDSKVEESRREQGSVRNVDEKHPVGVYEMENGSLIDIYSYHEQRAGSLVVTPEYACYHSS